MTMNQKVLVGMDESGHFFVHPLEHRNEIMALFFELEARDGEEIDDLDPDLDDTAWEDALNNHTSRGRLEIISL